MTSRTSVVAGISPPGSRRAVVPGYGVARRSGHSRRGPDRPVARPVGPAVDPRADGRGLEGSRPWARSAPTIPDSTSPVPAVASSGPPVGVSAPGRRPTGTERRSTVPGPLRSTTATRLGGQRPRRGDPVGTDRVAREARELAGVGGQDRHRRDPRPGGLQRAASTATAFRPSASRTSGDARLGDEPTHDRGPARRIRTQTRARPTSARNRSRRRGPHPPTASASSRPSWVAGSGRVMTSVPRGPGRGLGAGSPHHDDARTGTHRGPAHEHRRAGHAARDPPTTSSPALPLVGVGLAPRQPRRHVVGGDQPDVRVGNVAIVGRGRRRCRCRRR